MNTEAVCQLLDWDTEFFGVRIARVIPSRLTEPFLRRVLHWCQNKAIKCLYFLADSDHQETVDLCEQNGFHLVDIRMTFERDLTGMSIIEPDELPGVSIRPFVMEDIPYLTAIARDVYHDTRFYHDSYIPKEQVDALYATWIEKSCKGCAAKVLVLKWSGEPVGYVTCHVSDSQAGYIGLFGLHRAVQGMGLGRLLVYSALRWFADGGVQHVEVVTQGRNIKAQRLYQRCQFLTREVQLWYHKWFT